MVVLEGSAPIKIFKIDKYRFGLTILTNLDVTQPKYVGPIRYFEGSPPIEILQFYKFWVPVGLIQEFEN